MTERPTPYPEVNALLARLRADMRGVLGADLTGLYLYGSLAGGDFDPRSSDIDFAAATAIPLSGAQIGALEHMHKEIWQSGGKWAAKLEGCYVPIALLRRHDPHGPACPTINERQFYTAPLGSDWIIQRHTLRESGIVLAGPDPRELIDTVPPKSLLGAVLGYLWEWWQPMLAESSRLSSREYQAYAVLSMCRVLYTIEHAQHAIGSKPASARWAIATLGPQWASLIDQSIAWPEGEQPQRIEETRQLIQLTVQRSEPYRPRE